MEKFKKLKLSESLFKAIEDSGFKEPTEIQEKAIPPILEGKDVLGSAMTGSGKTLAFGAGIIENVEKGKGIQSLVLTPTRELAEQVSQSIKKFSKHKQLKIIEIYGGVGFEPQVRNIQTADVVVGTPGRVLDHLKQRTLNLSKVKILVLDEADRMLDMGFIEDVQRIIEHCSDNRQTLLFSATISHDIERIAKRYMKNPVLVEAEQYVDPSKLDQVYYDVPQNQKFSLLVHLLKAEESGLVMVFCNTRRNADFLVRNLRRYDVDAIVIHGGLTQNKRSNVMFDFHSGKAQILVCTDVAARGLDIKNVSHVYNYDIPSNSSDYIHRIGRTARAGKEGKAISLVSQRDYDSFNRVLHENEIKIKNEPMPEIESLFVRFDEDERNNRGRGGFSRGKNFSRGGSRGGFGGQRSGGSGQRSFGSRGKSFGGQRRSFGGQGRSSSREDSGSSQGEYKPRRRPNKRFIRSDSRRRY